MTSFLKQVGCCKYVSGIDVLAYVAERVGATGGFPCATGIGVERDGELIAGVVYEQFNGQNLFMHVAAEKGSRWMSRSFLRQMFDYPFNQLGVKRVTAMISDENESSIRLVKGVGFTLETRLVSAHPTGDLLVFSMFRENCRWIGAEHG